MTLQAHPYAEIFPMLPAGELTELAEDIRASGLRDKIVMFQGQILEGRNRYKALLQAGLLDEVDGAERAIYFTKFIPEIDGDPLKFVISKNVRRRHLNDIQRASVAAKIATLSRGRPSAENPPDGGISAREAANDLNVAQRQVERARAVHEHGVPELRDAIDQGEVPLATAERISRLSEPEQRAIVGRVLPGGARSIMSSRIEADDSLDYFPTPPWATRALFEHVLAHLKLPSVRSAWDPACGEGHMAEAMRSYVTGPVYATDIHAYGYGGLLNYVATPWNLPADVGPVDFIVSNPPFGDKTEQFVVRALAEAKVGVAMFVRLQWLETKGRYERVFSVTPPTQVAFFAERVPLCKGEWKPDGDTATAYIWLVWIKGRQPQAPFWIPPTCREELSRPGDEERYTAHPVIKALHKLVRAEDGDATKHDLETGEVAEDPTCANSAQVPPIEAEQRATESETQAETDRRGVHPETGDNSPDLADAASTEPAPVAPCAGGAGSTSPGDDGMDIPAFLRRVRPDCAAGRGEP